MNIPFPRSYKKALIKKTKNTTLRIQKEQGKYLKGMIYNICSYSGKDWGIKILIKEVVHCRIVELDKFRIPIRTRGSLFRQKGIDEKSEVDIIRFEIIE